ncbi:hypothetical protein [uncultured Duncaniella sp.]|uniref:hypothetical protein n=1 Tax=uncultured Duncaniella sp. TaxID=2768039 RepID=UPI0025B682A1|nr:hypothetical protein [uncultured Duncaniella sp.]
MNRNNIILDSISVDGSMVTYRFHVSEKLAGYFNTQEMFVEYDTDMTPVPQSILTIPFVASLMAFAWITDSVIWVKKIDQTFYDAITRIKNAYQDIYHYFPLKGRVVPSVFEKNQIDVIDNGSNAILLFSGGVDCHASLLRNLHKRPILLNIQGWYKTDSDIDPVADADKMDIQNFGKEMKLANSHVRSNFATVISDRFDRIYKKRLGDSWWHGFLHSMAFISIAIPYAYNLGIHEIIIASSLTTGLNHLCASNSTTDSEFRFASSGFTLHDGFELNRQDKMHIICDYQKKTGNPYFMRVCSFHDSNCCECEKCMRTVLGIIAECANPEDFGFHINDSLKNHWSKVLDKRIALMGFNSEKVIHWPHIKKRMAQNYDSMTDEQRDFVDWFLSYDFDAAKKIALLRYYSKNFFSILHRKIKGIAKG